MRHFFFSHKGDTLWMLPPRTGDIFRIKISEESFSVSCSVMSDSLQPQRLYPSRFLCLWNSQARIVGGLPFPSPGDLPKPGTEPGFPAV